MTARIGTVALELIYSGIIVYFVALNSVYLATSLIAFGEIRRYVRRLKSLDLGNMLSSTGAPPVTVLVPAYNEEASCVEAVRSFLSLNYAEYEILVVNDGSSDGTLDHLTQAFDLVTAARMPTAEVPSAPIKRILQSRRHRNLWVIDKEKGGKADALNAGLNFCITPLFCAVDADSILERDALTRIVRPFLEDATTAAAGGIIRIINGCRVKSGVVTNIRLPDNLLARFQVLEYLRAFLAGRMGWAAMEATLIISGAFGVFRRTLVVNAGGYASARTTGETVGEDMELVVRLHRYCLENNIPYRLSFVPDPVAWTECPEKLRALARQRERWQRGMTESLMRHRKMVLNPRYGRLGMVAMPYYFIFETFGPLLEVVGYTVFVVALLLGLVSTTYALTFFMVAVVFGMALSVAAVALEELGFRRYPRLGDLAHLFFLGIIENLGYRQLTAYWRFMGLVSAFRRKKGWGHQPRKGFATNPSASA